MASPGRDRLALALQVSKMENVETLSARSTSIQPVTIRMDYATTLEINRQGRVTFVIHSDRIEAKD
jgi:hypothetical protein